jgi:hypothetical protein
MERSTLEVQAWMCLWCGTPKNKNKQSDTLKNLRLLLHGKYPQALDAFPVLDQVATLCLLHHGETGAAIYL